MAFEDDMIDAGFSDAEDYLEYLMDDGDRRMARLLEQESRWSYDEEEPDLDWDENMEDWED